MTAKELKEHSRDKNYPLAEETDRIYVFDGYQLDLFVKQLCNSINHG